MLSRGSKSDGKAIVSAHRIPEDRGKKRFNMAITILSLIDKILI